NTKAAGEELVFSRIAFDVLAFEKADERLGHGQARHGQLPARERSSDSATDRPVCADRVAAWAISKAASASWPPTAGCRPSSRQSRSVPSPETRSTSLDIIQRARSKSWMPMSTSRPPLEAGLAYSSGGQLGSRPTPLNVTGRPICPAPMAPYARR